MSRHRLGPFFQAANQGIIRRAGRPVEARLTPAEAHPAAVVVERRVAAEVLRAAVEVVAVASTVVEVEAAVAVEAHTVVEVGAEGEAHTVVVAAVAAISD